jgi:hypothetical protein
MNQMNDYDYAALIEVSDRMEWQNLVDNAHTTLLSGLYPEQRRMVISRAKRKVSCTPRQVGKTEKVDVTTLVLGALTSPSPRALCAYVTDTGDHAKGLAWGPVLDALELIGIPHTPRIQDLDIDVHTPMGLRTISFFGCDDETKARKARGYQFWRYIVDEAQVIPDMVFKHLVQEHMSAGLGAWNGELSITGTPGRVRSGFYYDIWSHAAENGYETFRWTHDDNAKFPRWAGKPNWRALKDEWLESEKRGRSESAWKREFMGLWVSDDSAYCYTLESPRNLLVRKDIEHLPCVLGIDLGWTDKCAFVVLSADRGNGCVYVRHWEQHGHMGVEALAAKIQGLTERFHPIRIVMDSAGAGKIIQESMSVQISNRFGISVKPAKKADKAVHVEMLASLMEQGRFFAPKDEYWDHIANVTKDPVTGYEVKSCPCDMADATLYANREQYEFVPLSPPEPVKSDDELMLDAIISRDTTYGRIR